MILNILQLQNCSTDMHAGKANFLEIAGHFEYMPVDKTNINLSCFGHV